MKYTLNIFIMHNTVAGKSAWNKSAIGRKNSVGTFFKAFL